jgi:hypothetical protein
VDQQTGARLTFGPNWIGQAPTSALGQKPTLESGSGMSALPTKADSFILGIDVC